MEQSPLAQQPRPDIFKQKIVGLYETLFQDEHPELSEGLWREFFLLRPDLSSLQAILTSLTPDDLIHDHQLQLSSQQLFLRANKQVLNRHSPSDEIALETLTVFLECVLNKKYSSPSSDIIAVLAGLEGVDVIFTEFVAALDGAIRNGVTLDVRQKAIRVAIAAVSGAYQTGLVSYFINRDLFPSLMKLLQESDELNAGVLTLSLLALLLNYNKFEFQNPYQLRLEDFVDKSLINKMIDSTGTLAASCRDQYIAIQDDQPEGWNLGGTLHWLGLGGLAQRPQSAQGVISNEAADKLFATLPFPEAVTFLTTYDFANANKLFGLALVTFRPETKQSGYSFGSFLSLSSFLFQHAYRSTRTSLYACLNLLTLQILVSDQDIAKIVCSNENTATIRLCRQRQPLLPLVRNNRVLATIILDAVIAGIDHNLRKRLDAEMYHLFLSVLLRLLSFLSQSHIRLAYHWSELWRSLLSLLRFLTTYATDISSTPFVAVIPTTLTQILALALSSGEAFLPDAPSFDDLFYKLLEAHEILPRFRDAYSMSSVPAMEMLTTASAHCTALLEDHRKLYRGFLSPKEVGKVVRHGYETLNLQAGDGLFEVGPYREVERRGLLKKIARCLVQDARGLVGGGK